MVIPHEIRTYLAWTFETILPGTFKRNKAQFAHHDYPILAPLPTQKASTRPIENCPESGPYIYFVTDGAGRVCYVGKSKESSVVKRWVRPGIGGPSSHYWTHSTVSGGSVFYIADGLRKGKGPFSLRYAPISSILRVYGSRYGIDPKTPPEFALNRTEEELIASLSPIWNERNRRELPSRHTRPTLHGQIGA